MTEENENKEPNWDADSLWRRTEEAVYAAEGDTEFLIEEIGRIAEEHNLPGADELEEMLRGNLDVIEDGDIEGWLTMHSRSLSLIMKQQLSHANAISELQDEIRSLCYLIEVLIYEGAKSPKHLSAFCRNLNDLDGDAVEAKIEEVLMSRKEQE